MTIDLVRSEARPAASLRLICFPYAGGGASIFSSWSGSLPSTVEVYSVRLPGHESRLNEQPLTELSRLVTLSVSQFIPFLGKPFAFFGHSMGALIAFELTRELRRRNCPTPVHFFASGARAPNLFSLGPPISQLPEAEFLQKLRQFDGTQDKILEDSELIQLLLPTLRADFALCETYQYSAEEPLSCGITAFGGNQDHEVRISDLREWSKQTCANFQLRMFAGGHFFIRNAYSEVLKEVSREINRIVDQIRIPSYEDR